MLTGMTCAACARTIERALQKVDGVSQASVNFATSRAAVQFNPSVTDIPHLVAAVRDVGYDVFVLLGRVLEARAVANSLRLRSAKWIQARSW
ncbi:MAG: heavy-metal-associated domain-containing protein [Vicinamibacterales bacterium]|nr:heavy-metal-associated domain-containing protein [Vicinamibacterales bacterium]